MYIYIYMSDGVVKSKIFLLNIFLKEVGKRSAFTDYGCNIAKKC